ncbi:hypothetical protein [Pseudarthrobacter sp. Y6]|uniref:hypothetical protein n=1 Tax=Pseudarthrobacter sp. Y6 TaxID=3418422 RepID=UPI003CF9DFED
MPSPNTTNWSDATVIRSVSPASSTPSVKATPVMGEGHASLTNDVLRRQQEAARQQASQRMQCSIHGSCARVTDAP